MLGIAALYEWNTHISLVCLQSKNLYKFYEITDLINVKAISSGFSVYHYIFCYFKERAKFWKVIFTFYIILNLLNRHIVDEVSNIHKYFLLYLSENKIMKWVHKIHMHILKYYISSVRNMHPTSYISYCDFNDETGQIYITYIIHIHTHDIREGNGTPLQYSCLENPMYRGAW